jgi:hypothetical protein
LSASWRNKSLLADSQSCCASVEVMGLDLGWVAEVVRVPSLCSESVFDV